MTADEQPEGRLIEEARKKRAHISQNEAARRAEMSGTRWRQIVRGNASVGDGITISVRAPADTLARMAKVVDVTAEELKQIGREDAADELEASTEDAPATLEERAARADKLADRMQDELDELRREIRGLLGEQRDIR